MIFFNFVENTLRRKTRSNSTASLASQ